MVDNTKNLLATNVGKPHGVTKENSSTPVAVSTVLREQGLGTGTEAIDRVLQASPVGPVSTAIGDTFFGINHRQTPTAIQINKDFFGLTFFTRPMLNLTTENIRAIRQFTPLLTTKAESIQRIIRCILDSRLGGGPGGDGTSPNITSPFVDNQQAFIPVLSNHLLSISGWPDVNLPTMTSQAGAYKEEFSMADGVTANYSSYDINATFRNLPGDPITLLFLVWVHYASLVYQGLIVPYPEMIIQNEIDYQTRIYRLVLDSTKTYVKKIAACGAAFPLSSPIGASFNVDHGSPINSSNDQITIPFRAMGAMYQDDILIDEFNKTVAMFNSEMGDDSRASAYQQIPIAALNIFNNRGYPYINPNTYVLEWWVDKREYALRLPLVTTQQQVLTHQYTPGK